MRLDSEPWFDIFQTPHDRRHVRAIEELICWYWEPKEHRRALWMAYHRSHFDDRKVPDDLRAGYGLFGLPMEAIPFTMADPMRVYNLVVNVAAAYALWQTGGWAAVNDGKEPTWPPGM